MKKIMNHLIDIRQKILSGTLTHEQISELKKEITTKIDFWNSQMELDLVPRVNGVAVDVDQTSVVELYKIHVESLKQSKKLERQVTMPKSSLSIVKAHRHILLAVKKIVCNVDDNLEVFFSLFNGESGKYLSERFLMRLNKTALPDVAVALSSVKTKTLFTDLGRKSFASNVFIVCHVVRTGQMGNELSPKKKKNFSSRRPYACGVFNVQDNLYVDADYFGEERTFTVPLYLCNSDTDFHDVIVRKTSNKNASTSVNDGISVDVSLKVFNGDREKVIKVNPLWMPPDISVTRKLGFPEVILPGDTRNDMYITLDRGEFEKGGRTKNIEVSVTVLISNGDVLTDCIFSGTGSYATNEYQSLIFYHNNLPKWNETIKLNIPPGKFQDCHVLFTFKHCTASTTMAMTNNVKEKSRKAFAFAFLKPLRPDGTTIVDGSHQLITYKISLLDSKNPGKYLTYPSFVSDLSWVENQQNVNHSVRNTKHGFFVSTLTCSTKLTQNLDLVGLLKWRQQMNKIPAVLTSLEKVPGNEIVKFLQDILDALFSILNEDTERCGLLVFENLLFIINVLLNNKYQQFQAVLNTYIKHHFSAALAHRHIVALFNQVMLGKNDVFAIRKIANALQFILKFIMQSWALNIRTHPEQSNFEFKESIKELFARLNEAMGETGDGWHSVQSGILSSLPKAYGELSTVFRDEELAEMMQILFCSTRPNSLIIEKLNFLDGIITTSPLFYNASSRVTLMPLLLNCLHQQLSEKNELKTCAELLGNLLSCLSKTTSGSVYNEIEQISKALLQVVFQAVVAVDRSSPRAGSYVAILFTLLKMMTEKHYKSYLNSFSNVKDLRDFVNKAFGVFTNLLKRDIYPDDWFVMRIEGNYVILGAIQNISQALTDKFLDEDMFDYQLWNTYLHLAILFVSHDILDLDKYSEAKRIKILEKYGDMRHVMGREIMQMWNALGNLQTSFIPSMISSFLEMTLVPEPALRRETLPIFYDMMEKEMTSCGNIDRVEEAFINKLDVFLSNHVMGDENYKQLFGEILTERVEQNSFLKECGLSFVDSVIQLLERLLDYRNVISSREEYREMKMSCIVNLMNYYDEKGKEEMYLRYVLKLYNLHLEAENYCEAGFALYLYASRLSFEDWPLNAEENFPAQTEAERKEFLYKKAIELFDKGQLWESGIRLCKKIIKLYENETFDFIKLSEMLKTEAAFYRNIINTYRPEPVYFRVGFYGNAFPSFLLGKQFIYRGKPLEKIGEFCFRIQNEYPDAEVLRHNNPLEEEIVQSNKQYIQCCQVKPIADIKAVPATADNRIVSYYEVNWVNKFQFSRPFHVGEIVESSDEFATLWSEEVTLTTEIVFPGILPWFPVVASESTQLNPIENAVKTVKLKTRELEDITQELQDNDTGNINPLSMILKGVIDANVNGGISNYQKAFFTPDYARTNPQRKNEVSRLEEALHEQTGVLRRSLILHESRVTLALKPLHENLLKRYNEMLNDLPGDTRGYILIQRKWSLPNSSSPSQGSPSSHRRSTADTIDAGTLQRKFKRLLGRKTVVSYFEQDDENNRQSTSSEGIRESTSLMSLSDPSAKVSQSTSVPDLRFIGDSRPRLPQKKGRKLWDEDHGSPASLKNSRTSVNSSVSINSLTEFNELDELELAQAIENSSNLSTTDQKSSSQPMLDQSSSQKVPAVPPKKRASLSSTSGAANVEEMNRNVKSYTINLSSDGRYKSPWKKQSRSLDDLDKIGEEPELTTRFSRSQDLLDGAGSNVNNNENNSSDIKDEDAPPPLLPKTYKSKKYSEDPYDVLALPANQSNSATLGRVYPRNTRAVYDMVTIRGAATLDNNIKHNYANLDKPAPSEPGQRDSSSSNPEDNYDLLVLPNSQSVPAFRSRKGAYDVVTLGRPGASNNVSKLKAHYDTVASPREFTREGKKSSTLPSTIGVYEQIVLNKNRSRTSTAEETPVQTTNTDLNENVSSETPPPLKPKNFKKDKDLPVKEVPNTTTEEEKTLTPPLKPARSLSER